MFGTRIAKDSGDGGLFCKTEARRRLDFTACGLEDGNRSIVVVNNEIVLCLLILYIVSLSFLYLQTYYAHVQRSSFLDTITSGRCN
jgi:hypothetical protein